MPKNKFLINDIDNDNPNMIKTINGNTEIIIANVAITCFIFLCFVKTNSAIAPTDVNSIQKVTMLFLVYLLIFLQLSDSVDRYSDPSSNEAVAGDDDVGNIQDVGFNDHDTNSMISSSTSASYDSPETVDYNLRRDSYKYPQSDSTHIEINAGDGSTITHQYTSGSNAHLKAETPGIGAPQDIHIHVHQNSNLQNTLSTHAQQIANDITNMAHIHKPHQFHHRHCQNYIDRINELEKQNSRMKIHLATFELHMQENNAQIS